MHAYVFPFRNHNPAVARWISADPSGHPDGINNQFYACVPTTSIDVYGLYFVSLDPTVSAAIQNVRDSAYGKDPNSAFYIMDNLKGNIEIKAGDQSGYNRETGTITVSQTGDGVYAARDKNGNLTNTTGSLES